MWFTGAPFTCSLWLNVGLTSAGWGASQVVLAVKNLAAIQEMWVWSLGWEDYLEKEMATCSSVLSGKFHGQRSLAGYSPWDCRESDTTERLSSSTLIYHNSWSAPQSTKDDKTWQGPGGRILCFGFLLAGKSLLWICAGGYLALGLPHPLRRAEGSEEYHSSQVHPCLLPSTLLPGALAGREEDWVALSEESMAISCSSSHFLFIILWQPKCFGLVWG